MNSLFKEQCPCSSRSSPLPRTVRPLQLVVLSTCGLHRGRSSGLRTPLIGFPLIQEFFDDHLYPTFRAPRDFLLGYKNDLRSSAPGAFHQEGLSLVAHSRPFQCRSKHVGESSSLERKGAAARSPAHVRSKISLEPTSNLGRRDLLDDNGLEPGGGACPEVQPASGNSEFLSQNGQ